MRKLICALFLAVIAINAMNENIAFLDTIKKTDFGRTILQTMQIQFQTSDGINSVLALLQKLEDGIKKDAAQDKAEHVKKTTDLKNQIANLKSVVAIAKKQIASDVASLSQKESDLKVALKNQAQNQAKVNAKKELLAEATKAREAAHVAFKKAVAKLYKAISALNEGKDIIETLQINGKAFAEISETPVFAQVTNSFKGLAAMDNKFQGFFQMFVTLFTQKVGIQANQALVKNILDIFEKLVAGLQHDIELLIAKEKAEVLAYKATKAGLLSAINKFQALVNQYADEASELRSSIAQLNENLKNNRAVVKTKSAQLVNAESELVAENKDYAARVKKRNEELMVIAQVRNIFKTQFNVQAREYVKNVKL